MQIFKAFDEIQDPIRLLKYLKLQKTEYKIDQTDNLWYVIVFNLLTRSKPLAGLSPAAQEVLFSQNEIQI